MGRRIKISSFEPRHLRQAVEKLQLVEKRLFHEKEPKKPASKIEPKSPSLLQRWWRILMGGV